MFFSALLIWFLAIILLLVVFVKDKDKLPEAFGISFHQLLVILPRLPLSLLAAGFITSLLPEELISSWIGYESGFIGVFIAACIGSIIPSGPIVAFPVAIALYKLEAGTPQLIAFLTGWSSFQITRMLLWEVPFLGWSFVFRRVLVSIPLPFVAAGISMIIIFLYS